MSPKYRATYGDCGFLKNIFSHFLFYSRYAKENILYCLWLLLLFQVRRPAVGPI